MSPLIGKHLHGGQPQSVEQFGSLGEIHVSHPRLEPERLAVERPAVPVEGELGEELVLREARGAEG